MRTSTPDAEGGYRVASLMVEHNPDLTGLFAINDVTAIGTMGRLGIVAASPAATSP